MSSTPTPVVSQAAVSPPAPSHPTRAIDYLRLSASRIGLRATVHNVIARKWAKLTTTADQTTLIPYRAKGLKAPLYCRYGTSDANVFHQMFVDREYAALGFVQDPKVIVDCGGNVGFAAAYFLSQYPKARLILVEPDSSNLAQCRRNLAPYADRVTLIQAGIWAETTGLIVEHPLSGSEDHWSIQVRAAKPGETPDLEAIDLNSLCEQQGIDHIDILKIDIERSELAVFDRNYQDWMSKVGHLAIELHGPDCEAVFYNAIQSRPYETWNAGELTFCRFTTPAATASALV
jgi:FkbM family methyltransferase